MRVSRRVIVGITVASTLAASYGLARGRAIESYEYGYHEYLGHSYVWAGAYSGLDSPFRFDSTFVSAYMMTESGSTFESIFSHGPGPDAGLAWNVHVDSRPIEGSCVDASATIFVIDAAHNQDTETNDGCTSVSW